MKRLLLILACLTLSLNAQNYWPVTAVGCITDASGAVMTNGVLTAIATDGSDRFIPFRAGGAFQSVVAPVTRGIAAGSLTASLQLANPLLTSPLNILYRITIKDNTTSKITVYPLINVVPNDVFVSGAFTVFNLCTANLLPNVGVVTPGTTPLLTSGDVTMTGRLGIGTAPSFPLHVKANAVGDPDILVESGASASPVIELRDGAGTPNRYYIGLGSSTRTDGNFFIYDKRLGLYRLVIVPNGMWLSGYLGIGLSNPVSKFANTGVNPLDGGGTGITGLSLTWENTGQGYVGSFYNSDSADSNAHGILAKTLNQTARIITANFGTGNGHDIWFVTGNGISKNGYGHKHKRVASCTTAASTGAVCNTDVIWDTAFVDANYTVTCSFEAITNQARFIYTQGINATGLGTVIESLGAAASGIIECSADHDP